MRTRAVRASLAVGLVLAGVAACGGDDGDKASSSSTTSTIERSTSSTEVAVSSTARPATDEPDIGHETDGDKLLDGRHFGYITTLIAGHNEIDGEFDLAELYTGQQAIDEANADGTQLDGDYYIRNVNPEERAIQVDPEAVVMDVDYDHCCEPQRTSPAQFAADRDNRGETRTACYITIVGGLVTSIDEVYFP